MMENQAGLYDVAPAGIVSQLMSATRHSSLEESLINTASNRWKQHLQPTLPHALLFIHTLHVFTMYRTAWAGR